MSRALIASFLVASLILGMFMFVPDNSAEYDEEYYEDQPYLQYDFHIHSLRTKHWYNHTHGEYGFPDQHLIAFPGDENFEYPELTGSVYLRREYSQEESQEFRKLAVKSFTLYTMDQNYKKIVNEILNETEMGVLSPEEAIIEIADITNSTNSIYFDYINKEIPAKELITLEMIKWIRDEFDIKSMLTNIPSTNLDNRISFFNETIKSYSAGDIDANECMAYLEHESNIEHYHENHNEAVSLNIPTIRVDDVQAVFTDWHFESVGPSSSLLGSLSGNDQERLWIGQWLHVTFPNLTHTAKEYTVYFDWPEEDFTGKETSFFFSVGQGQIITEVSTENSVDYMGYSSLEESYQEWFSFQGKNGSINPVTVKFSPGYGKTEGSTDWQDAVDYATTLTYQNQSGHLATITTLEEAELVYSLLDGSSYWLGGFHNLSSPEYTEPSGGWEWITGEPFNHTLWPTSNEFDGRFCYDEVNKERLWDRDKDTCVGNNYVWVSEYYIEPNEAGEEDCLEAWGFDKQLNDGYCKSRGWMGFVVEYELNGSNHYEAYVPTWEWDAENETDVFTYVLATPLTDNERNDILKEDGDPDADNDGIVDKFDDDDDNDGIVDENDMDDDNDGIDDDNDRCPGTPIGEDIDEEGCSASQLLGEITTEDGGLPSLSFMATLVSIIGITIIRKRYV